MAAGFGSLRRFNETFQALFRRPPTALRRSSGADISAGAEGEVSLLLRYRPPYDWPAMLDFLQRPRDPRRRKRRRRRLPAHDRIRRPARNARRCAGRGQRASRDRALSQIVEPAENHRAPAARVRSRRRSRCDRGATGAGSRPCAAGRGAARPARARRLGRVRAGDARGARPADHRARRHPPRGQAGRRLRRNACAIPIALLTHVFPEPAALAGADLAALGMPRSRASDLVRRRRGRRRRSRIYSRPAAASKRRSPSSARCRASANGPRNISRCASCANPTPFPPPISA